MPTWKKSPARGCTDLLRSRNQCQPTTGWEGSLPHWSQPQRLKDVAAVPVLARLPSPAASILPNSLPIRPSQEVVTGPPPLRTHTPFLRSSSVFARVNPWLAQAVSRLDWLCPVHSSNLARVAASFDMSLVVVFGSTLASCVQTH